MALDIRKGTAAATGPVASMTRIAGHPLVIKIANADGFIAGHTWLGWLNLLILQWLSVRLFREVDGILGFNPDGTFKLSSGSVRLIGLWWGIIPRTGWGEVPYRYYPGKSQQQREWIIWSRRSHYAEDVTL